MHSYYYSSDLSLSLSLVEQYGETNLLKKEEKQVGYTDNGSTMYLEMEQQLRCYDFQHSSQGQEEVKVTKGKEDIIF